MAKYIDAEAFKQYLLDLKKQVNEIMPGQSAISGATLSELIDRFPATADVVEVRHYLSEWCTDCKEYDKERHCCPRFNRVIEETVAEMKSEGWQKVRHGRWVDNTPTTDEYGNPLSMVADSSKYIDLTCSVCGQKVTTKTNYCPNCGAKMDEVE